MEGERVIVIGERRWPVSKFESTDTEMPTPLDFFRRRQAVVAFESGWQGSILWGSGTYSDNHDCWRSTDPWVEEPERVEFGAVRFDTGLIGDPFEYLPDAAVNAILLAMSDPAQFTMTLDALTKARES